MSYAAAGAWGAQNGPILIRRALDREQPAVFLAIAAAVLPCSPWPRSSGSATPCTAPPTCPGRARSSSGVRRHCGRGDHHLVRGNEPVVVEQTSPRPPLLGNRSFRCGRHRHPTLPRGPRHAAGHGDRADRVAGDHGRCLDGSLVALRRLRAACRSLSLPVGAGDARSSAPRGDLHDTVWSRAHVGPADDRVHLGPRLVCATPVSFRLCGHRDSDTKCFPVDIPTDTTDRAPRGESPTPMAYLAFEARSAVALMARYAARPHLRAHLGTSRSLDWSPTPPSAVDEATAGLQPWV